ncbi:MAG: hypothetical protein IH577_04745 [Deltaproteobacteria bacterium]|nr:hypothetical protein [Deltaproteobacteria bacterium]
MDVRVLDKVLSEMTVDAKGTWIGDLIHAIQRTEGNFDCFGTARDGACDQENCKWREACIAESAFRKGTG